MPPILELLQSDSTTLKCPSGTELQTIALGDLNAVAPSSMRVTQPSSRLLVVNTSETMYFTLTLLL